MDGGGGGGFFNRLSISRCYEKRTVTTHQQGGAQRESTVTVTRTIRVITEHELFHIAVCQIASGETPLNP